VVVLAAFAFTAHAESIGLPHTVPSFNQAYTDGTGAWGNAALGTGGCPDTIAESGCLLTAFASVLAYYGIDLHVTSSESSTGRARTGMDPGILNDWLRSHGGYGQCSEDPAGACCLVWENLPADVALTFHTNRSEAGLTPLSMVAIDHALREGQPIVAGVHWDSSCRSGSSQSEDCHWIVITGKIGDSYTILDTYNPKASSSTGVRTTLKDGVKGSYVVDRFVIVAPASPVEGEASSSTDTVPSGGAANGFVVLLVALVIVAAVVAVVTSLEP
jgi:hypothetical protein